MKINKLKKARTKRALKSGLDDKNSMLAGGYSLNTARNAGQHKVVQECKAEILKELQAKDIDIDWLINSSNNIGNKASLCKQHGVSLKAIDNISRYVGIGLSDKPTTNINILNVMTDKDVTTLTEYIQSRNKTNDRL